MQSYQLPEAGAYLPEPRPGPGAVAARTLAALLRSGRHAVKAWRDDIRTQREIAAFRALPDHVLRDIGVSRHGLPELDATDPSRRGIER